MRPEDAEEFTQSLGQIAAGAWRQLALAERLGVPKALGLTTREWAEERLGGYVRLSIPERQEAVAELTEEGMSTKVVADVLGVDPSTVRADKRGNSRPVESKTEPEQEELSEEEQAARENSRIAILPDDLADRVRDNGLDLDEAESVVAERRDRVNAWVDQVRAALSVLSRMAGHPIPAEFKEALNKEEHAALIAVLKTIPKGVGE